MCGIAGYIGNTNHQAVEDTLRRMVRRIERRGPDGEGVAHWPGAGLGHRRLAILDLSELGRQPMLSHDGRVGVVFNGCIYNFLELKNELEQSGHQFHSTCDTEVVLRGYLEWGALELARRMRGMFAVGIWDDHCRRLTLFRDRLGVKPLFYAIRNGQIAFGSTLQTVAEAAPHLGLASAIDPAGLLEYLEFGYVTDAHTIYRGFAKLGAGRLLEWQNGLCREEVYWQLPAPEEDSRIGFEEAVVETERILREAVRLRLIADVKVGALLSGGIDSALVCWAVREAKSDITAFTVRIDEDASDETEAASQTAKLLGIPHEVISLPLDGERLLDEVTSAYSEPFGAQSATAMLQVSAAVSPHAKVLLTGDGGDDLYLGYWFYPTYLKTQQLARCLPPWAGDLYRLGRPLLEKISALRRPKHFLDYVTGGLGGITRAHDGLPYYTSRRLLGPRLADEQLTQRRIPLSVEAARRLMKDLIEYQQKTWFVSEFMTKVDGGTMYHALEARAPLLDHVLWEFAAKLPVELRLRGGELKAVLREIVRRRIDPAIASRRKQGFTVPVERWLGGPWKKTFVRLAADSILEREGWLRPGALHQVAAELSTERLAPRQAWFLMVLESWARKQSKL